MSVKPTWPWNSFIYFRLTPRLSRLDIFGRDSWVPFAAFLSLLSSLWMCSFIKIGLQKWFFFCQAFFSWIWISKMSVKMDIRIITNNHAAESKIGSSQKINFRADQTHESHPTAWESTTSWAFTIGSVFNLRWYLLVKLRRLVDQRRCRKQSFFSHFAFRTLCCQFHRFFI